ncbi:MAG: YjgN family protein [Spirochaetota bacterium]
MENRLNALAFKGKGLDFFFLLLKNLFLTMITFGIYSFWAKIEIQKYLNRNTFYLDEGFDFHGTGKEKFIGFLKGMGIVSAAALLLVLLSNLLAALLGMRLAQIIQGIAAYAALLAVIPLIIVGKRRYLMSRSSWRGIRFIFSGKWQDLAKIIFRDGLFSFLSLGIYLPWFLFHYEQFMINHSSFGGEKFSFSGESGSFARVCFKGFFLSILTLGIYIFWFKAEYQRYLWNNTAIQGKKMSCDLTGGKLLTATVIYILIIVCTLMFGAAWAMIRIYRVMLESIALEGDLDFAAIKAGWDEKASALADGISDASDVLDSISNMIS